MRHRAEHHESMRAHEEEPSKHKAECNEVVLRQQAKNVRYWAEYDESTL